MDDTNLNSYLNFFVSVYQVDGTYLGMQRLANQLSLCENVMNADQQSIFQFGTSFHNDCEFYVPQLLSQETLFYELHLQDSDGSYLALPAMVLNLKDSSGNTPNANTNNGNGKKVFVRRFTVIDNLSGIGDVNGYLNKATPKVVQYAKSIKLVVSLTKGSNSNIYRPHIEIAYEQMDISGMSEKPFASASFHMVY